jgi:hypothetical protein
LERKPADAKIVMCEPDHEFCLISPEGSLYQIGGVIFFPTRDALVQVLQRLGITAVGDNVWL